MGPPVRLSAPHQLSQLLVSRRKARKLTQADVGRRLDLTQNRISQLEADPARISTEQLLLWLAALGLTIQVTEARRSDPDDKANTKGTLEW